jgi:hypothetical protein
MISKSLLIGKVSPYQGKQHIIVDNQDTIDIIEALINNHYKYRKEYDKIYTYFDGGNVEETGYNVWKFLKDKFVYIPEPEKLQIIHSPGSILTSDTVGIDCKAFTTWSAGIMDAYRRNTGKNFEIFYRFASYDPFDKTPQHVFCVVKDKGIEYWIDPVLNEYDEKKQPYYYKDKKIKNMALVAMSGIPEPSNTITGSVKTIDWFSKILESIPPIISASKGGSSTSGGSNPNPNPYNPYSGNTTPPPDSESTTPPPATTEISTNTILLIGAAGLAAYFIFSKRK